MGACCPSLRKVCQDARLQLPGSPCRTAQCMSHMLKGCCYGLQGRMCAACMRQAMTASNCTQLAALAALKRAAHPTNAPAVSPSRASLQLANPEKAMSAGAGGSMAAGKGPLSPFGGAGTPLTGATTEPKLKVAVKRGEAIGVNC